ncbi:MAG TPA: dienelactone hydrolase family protein [Thermoanaerobaculia bacterium]|nr:dienelactone hydrolase family protein [Thermoanaerobaculia bacterium]
MYRLVSLLLIFSISCVTNGPTQSQSRLETTPRHDEWVRIPVEGKILHAWVTYPETASTASAIVLIHENRGLDDWARSVADRLSENGYLVIAPDLLSGMAPGGGRASDFPSSDAAREATSKLSMPGVIADLHAAADYVLRLPAANGKLFVAGFCWGGARTWVLANARPGLSGSFVFYGTGPQDAAGIAAIDAPVFGFYGGNDARVNATIPKTEDLMRQAGKRFEPVIYEGAGHAFMRLGEASDASDANRRAHNEGWARSLELLGQIGR